VYNNRLGKDLKSEKVFDMETCYFLGSYSIYGGTKFNLEQKLLAGVWRNSENIWIGKEKEK
jgi:hypothetical protein